ncbi:RNA 2',3'-cyclic phosphodiesterase [Celeribacter indicus]|uniref:RNA 2',3'-cyclic phosphodiesterase n=1 Tax=Celeribacter indicus TaxID=1208324 RepID=A0A0B5DXR8_9RHOB|nr:RNA 2',3'-cyclic phosphodiesterase [Celeribacter indicus]AJE45905.1 2'-5' RNA ligase [Celeribacter indicus]SDW63424.1 2'-5' RNA ligase [Celeribacter indicus]
MRCFVGLPLPEDLTDRLEEIAGGLRVGRAVPAENMHLTLAFLDDQPEAALDALHEELEGMRATAPRIRLEGLDLFGGDKPRVLFAAVAQDAALSELRRTVRGAARAAGIELPHERFRPHVTLVRFSRFAPGERDALDRLMARHAGFVWPAFRAAEMALMQSVLTHEGAVYEALARYPLAP